MPKGSSRGCGAAFGMEGADNTAVKTSTALFVVKAEPAPGMPPSSGLFKPAGGTDGARFFSYSGPFRMTHFPSLFLDATLSLVIHTVLDKKPMPRYHAK
jgi:hypothetical protein